MPAKTEQAERVERKRIRVRFDTPEDMPISFANHLMVGHDPHNFFVTFFHQMPPVISSKEDLDQTEEITAHAVARFAVPASAMAGFIRALQNNYEKWEKLTALISKEGE